MKVIWYFIKRIFLRWRRFSSYSLTHLQKGAVPRPQDFTTHHRVRWFWEKREKCVGVTREQRD